MMTSLPMTSLLSCNYNDWFVTNLSILKMITGLKNPTCICSNVYSKKLEDRSVGI